VTRRVSSEATHEGAANASASRFDRRLVEHVSAQHLRSRVVDPKCRRIADKRRDHMPSVQRLRDELAAPSACRADNENASGLRVRHETWTANRRSGSPCERGRLKASPRRSSNKTAQAAHGLVNQIDRALAAVAA
jgi:hypothetical protein